MSVAASFTTENFREFLASGWFLALDSERIVLGWGEIQASEVPPVGSSTCALYAPDFYLEDSKPWKIPAQWALLSRSEFVRHVLTACGSIVNSDMEIFHDRPNFGESQRGIPFEAEIPEKIQWSEPDPRSFEKQWQAIQTAFRDQGLDKAVPVVFAATETMWDESNRLQALKRLLQQPNALSIYGFWNSLEGILGATPELLFYEDSSGKISTMALAGTRAKPEAGPGGALAHQVVEASNALLADPKERHEHALVVHDLLERLGGLGRVQASETRVLELPTLLHLLTPISVHVNDAKPVQFQTLVELLHPTPALGVAPRRYGFERMLEWDDPLRRGRFGAPFGVEFSTCRAGVVSRERHCLVAIRNIQWEGKQIRLGSGCGVVPASAFEREWQELKIKRESVKRMLDL